MVSKVLDILIFPSMLTKSNETGSLGLVGQTQEKIFQKHWTNNRYLILQTSSI